MPCEVGKLWVVSLRTKSERCSGRCSFFVSLVQAYSKLSTLAGFSLSGSASRVSGGVVDGVTVHSAGVSDLLQSSDVAAAFGRIAAGKNGLWSANTGTGPLSVPHGRFVLSCVAGLPAAPDVPAAPALPLVRLFS